MKLISKLSRITSFSLVILFMSLGISCKDKKDKDDNIGAHKDSSGCELISSADIRLVFNLKGGIEIEQNKKLDEICYYNWAASGQEKLHYSVRFGLARWAQKGASEIDKTWEEQNETIYKEYNSQKVSGVGDKASWSDYDNGQLRVAADGHIFYISIYVKPKDENPMDTQEKIDKTSALAKRVIKKM